MTSRMRSVSADEPGSELRAALAAVLPGAGLTTPMKTPDWYLACYDTLYPAGAARVVATEGGVAPLARRGWLLPVLVLAGAEELMEASEPPVADDAAAQRLAEAILSTRRAVRFGYVPAEGVFVRAFLAAARGRGYLVSAPTGGSPVLPLHDGWKDPVSQLSSGRRSDFRRMRRRADELGPVRFEALAPAPAEVEPLLDRAFAVEAKSWKGDERTAVVHNRLQRDFFYRYCTLVAAEGRCRIAFLTIGGETAAMQVMVRENGALWLFKIGYDEAFARVSPGSLLLAEVIGQAAAEGLDRVEFLGQDAPWTALWCKDLRANIKLRYYPYTPRGLAALARDGATVAARRLRRAWRAQRAGA